MIRFNPDPAAFNAAIAGWIAADPLPFALISAISEWKQAWRGVLERDGQPVAVLARTPGWPAMLASPGEPDAEAVAEVAGLVRDFGGINAPVAWAEAIVSAQQKAIGVRSHSRMGLRLHRLIGPPRLPRPALGAALDGHAVAPDLIRSWLGRFSHEIDASMPWTPPTDQELKPTLAQYRFWIDGEQPVSMTCAMRPFHGGWSINRVYTPPEHRRHGYAGAVVHALCQAKLAEGASYLALYTDLANPTSNRLYAEIGFAPVSDQVRILWSLP
ncbi:N-acetyltransferase [Planctomycetota bacterium]|nr:N-acetyltransferase [Planctomycetota bacterium]